MFCSSLEVAFWKDVIWHFTYQEKSPAVPKYFHISFECPEHPYLTPQRNPNSWLAAQGSQPIGMQCSPTPVLWPSGWWIEDPQTSWHKRMYHGYCGRQGMTRCYETGTGKDEHGSVSTMDKILIQSFQTHFIHPIWSWIAKHFGFIQLEHDVQHNQKHITLN